jgi:hypothetical protein
LFQKRIYSIFLGTLVGKRKQTIFEKRWFDITNPGAFCDKQLGIISFSCHFSAGDVL